MRRERLSGGVASAVAPHTAMPVIDPEQFKVQGIMKDGGGKMIAIINGRIVSVGTVVAGSKVVEVRADR